MIEHWIFSLSHAPYPASYLSCFWRIAQHVRQLNADEIQVDNKYTRAVGIEGNHKAR